MKKQVGIILILIIIFSFYFCIIKILSDNKNNGSVEVIEKKKNIIITDNNKVFEYSANSWKQKNYEEYINKKVKVYDGNKYLGEKQITYVDRWYISDENINFYDLNSHLFAYFGDYNIDLIDVNYEETNSIDKNIINKYLTEKNKMYVYDELNVRKYTFKIDEIVASVYIIINADSLDKPLIGDEFAYTFMYHNDIINEVEETDNFNCEMRLLNFMEMDSKMFALFSCIYPSNNGVSSLIYEYNGKFEKIISVR